MKNLLSVLSLSLIMFGCSSDGLNDDFKTEEPFTYKNGVLSTGKVSSTGLSAPSGFEFSEIPYGSDAIMFAYHLNWDEMTQFTVSDDFIISKNESWKIESFSFFMMNPEIQANSLSSIKYLVLEIYDGDPKLTTSKKVFGNMDENVFKSVSTTNINRITNLSTLASINQRPQLLYKVDANVNNLQLQSGHYWYKMTFKFNKGEDWAWFIPRLPANVNNSSSFNAYFQHTKSGDSFPVDYGWTSENNSTPPPSVNFETPFEITGIKTIN